MRQAVRTLGEQGQAAQEAIEKKRIQGTQPSLALDKYAGSYADPDSLYGRVWIEQEADRLVLRRNAAFVAELEHWHHDTFRARWRDSALGRTFATFQLNAAGEADELELENVGEFRRAPAPPDSTPAIAMTEDELRRYTGTYASPQVPVEIVLEVVGGNLRMTVPGQPVYTLVPLSRTRFRPEGAPAGYFVDFALDGDRVTSLTLVQGSERPSFTLTPKQP